MIIIGLGSNIEPRADRLAQARVQSGVERGAILEIALSDGSRRVELITGKQCAEHDVGGR